MASNMTTKNFFAEGTPKQFEWTLEQYDQALRLKAESKSSKPENVIKLDKWYQNELPKKIKSRGKDAHLVHDELVQTIKWKLAVSPDPSFLMHVFPKTTSDGCKKAQWENHDD